MNADASPYDAWADIYDAVFSYVVDDIPFYLEQAATHGDGGVLELGCGTGRVAIPLALSGVSVTALDSSPAMLARARQKAHAAAAKNLTLIQADMRDFDLRRKFSLVIIPFRGFLSLLSAADQTAALRAIKRHLLPGGRLALDIFVPDLNMLVQEGDVPFHFRDVTDPATGNRLIIWNQSTYDAFTQIMTIRTAIEELDHDGIVRRKLYRDFALRYIFRFEMSHLLRASGYDILHLYGDFRKSEFTPESPEMIWIATPTA